MNGLFQCSKRSMQRSAKLSTRPRRVADPTSRATLCLRSRLVIIFIQLQYRHLQKTITLLNSTLRKSHVLLTKASTESSAIQQAAPSLDALGDKLVCISAAGYLVNMVEDLNNFIQETHDSLQTADQRRSNFVLNPCI